MHATTLREYQMQERQLRSTLEMVKRFAVGFQAGRDEMQLQVRMGMLDDSLNKFYIVRRKIDVLTDAAGGGTTTQEKEQIDPHSEVMWEFENMYCEVKAMLQQLQPKPEITNVPVAAGAAALSAFPAATCRVKLPEIKLPTFSGELGSWITFRDTFRSLIHNNPNLSAIDRFTYLRASLSGEALQEIGAVEITGANYEVAWSLLKSRYENKRLILKTHLDAVFVIEPMKKESFDALNHVLSNFEKNLQMIQKLGVKTADWSVLLAHMLMSKLDSTTLRHWETHYNSKEFVRYEELVECLRDHCAVLRSIAPVVKTNTVERERLPKYACSYAVSVEPRSCFFCEGSQHNVFQCDTIRRMNAADRLSTARKNWLCFNCLNTGHTGDKCTRGFCTICKRKHHTLLHECFASATTQAAAAATDVPTAIAQPQVVNQQNAQSQQLTPQSQNPNTPTQTTQPNTQDTVQPTTLNTTTCNHSFTLTSSIEGHSREVLLPTAIVCIRDVEGHMVLARALLDSGSQKNLMTEEFAQKLNGRRVPDYLRVKGIGTAEATSSSAVTVTVCPRLSDISQFSESMKFYVLPTVTANLPVNSVDIEQLGIPQDMKLADPHFHCPGTIDVLIGAEFYHGLLLNGMLKLGGAGPSIQNTMFGWIVSGAVDGEITRLPRVITEVNASATDTEVIQEVQNLLAEIWELDSSSAPYLTEELLQIIDEEEVATCPEAAETYPSLFVLTKAVARVRRLVQNAQRDKPNCERSCFITVAEHDAALMTLVKLAQRECFPEELSALEGDMAVKTTSRIGALNPKLVDGVILVGGRQRNAAMSASQNFPIILDNRHPFTKLIIHQYHHQYNHAGVQPLITCVRERFWPLNIRRTAKQVIHECVACSLNKPKIIESCLSSCSVAPLSGKPSDLDVLVPGHALEAVSTRGNRRILPERGSIYASSIRTRLPNAENAVARQLAHGHNGVNHEAVRKAVKNGAHSCVTRKPQRAGLKDKGFRLGNHMSTICVDSIENVPYCDGGN